jgi:hypothetical protein
MNLIKRLAIPALLAVSFSSQADSDIDNKVNCAANAIVLNLMFEDKNNTEIPTQKERVGVWSNAINKKLIELGNSPAEAKNILKDAIRKSKDARTSIYKDKSKTKSEQKENFDNWWIQTTGCMKKYSDIQ